MVKSVSAPAIVPSQSALPPALLNVCFALCVINATFLPAAYFAHHWIYDANGQGIPTDFVNVWAAGKLVLDGHPALAYDWDIQKQVEVAVLGQSYPGNFAWHYPPPFLFVAAVLAHFPYAVAFIGWAAASGTLSAGAWILFAILFFWQFPHFMAIAWMYREDYGRAGILMLPVVDRSGDRTFRLIIATSAILIPVSVLPAVLGMATINYFYGALILGLLLLLVSYWANRVRTNVRAKWLMHATVAHIPLLLGWMILDKISR